MILVLVGLSGREVSGKTESDFLVCGWGLVEFTLFFLDFFR